MFKYQDTEGFYTILINQLIILIILYQYLKSYNMKFREFFRVNID